MAVGLVRRRSAVAAVAAAAALSGAIAAWAGTSSVPPAITTQFGYIKSLVPKGSTYQLKLHPAFFLTGSTADAAAVAAGVIKPGQHIDNDYYVVMLPPKVVLTYNVPASTPVTVISNLSRPMKITVKK